MRVIASPLLKGIIASLWEFTDPEYIPVDTVFILTSTLTRLPCEVEACHAAGKRVFVDMDFVEGLSEGKAAIEFLRSIGVDGLISVKLSNFHYAKKIGMPFVLRVFALDSKAVEKAYNQVKSNGVDIVEILPGCASLKVGKMFKALGINVITGGLVTTRQEAKKLLQIVDAISTSARNLWTKEEF
ncbi:MAG: glycerol uptake operon antiterminator [bacterium]|nr:glycerol uptake operon antiterminator [bacterium]